MTDFKVILSQSTFNVKVQEQETIKVTPIIGGLQVPAKFEDLLDVNVDNSNKKDKYVVMYNSGTDKYSLVNPDEVLSAASDTETTQPGLPDDFLNTLDVDLDDRIDIDGGTW
jgi:hypothetical protein